MADQGHETSQHEQQSFSATLFIFQSSIICYITLMETMKKCIKYLKIKEIIPPLLMLLFSRLKSELLKENFHRRNKRIEKNNHNTTTVGRDQCSALPTFRLTELLKYYVFLSKN